MTVPANMIALMMANTSIVSVSITQPANGSGIYDNSTTQFITGSASSTGGTITSIQYKIDSGSYINASFTPGPSPSYTGGDAGHQGAGAHTVSVKATDSTGITKTVTNNYNINVPTPPTFSWTKRTSTPSAYVYAGDYTQLDIGNAVSLNGQSPTYTYAEYTAAGNFNGSTPFPIAFRSSFNFVNDGYFQENVPLTYNANTRRKDYTLYLNGSAIGVYSFFNISASPYVNYGPSSAPTGTTLTLTITGHQANANVSFSGVYSPTGGTISLTSLGTTDSAGNFSYSNVSNWASNPSDTSISITIYIGGISAGVFNFTRT